MPATPGKPLVSFLEGRPRLARLPPRVLRRLRRRCPPRQPDHRPCLSAEQSDTATYRLSRILLVPRRGQSRPLRHRHRREVDLLSLQRRSPSVPDRALSLDEPALQPRAFRGLDNHRADGLPHCARPRRLSDRRGRDRLARRADPRRGRAGDVDERRDPRRLSALDRGAVRDPLPPRRSRRGSVPGADRRGVEHRHEASRRVLLALSLWRQPDGSRGGSLRATAGICHGRRRAAPS